MYTLWLRWAYSTFILFPNSKLQTAQFPLHMFLHVIATAALLSCRKIRFFTAWKLNVQRFCKKKKTYNKATTHSLHPPHRALSFHNVYLQNNSRFSHIYIYICHRRNRGVNNYTFVSTYLPLLHKGTYSCQIRAKLADCIVTVAAYWIFKMRLKTNNLWQFQIPVFSRLYSRTINKYMHFY